MKTVLLSNIGEFKGGVTSIKPSDYGYGTPFITYRNVYKNSKIDTDDLALMNVPSKDLDKLACRYGDVFFTASSETPNEVAMSSVLLDDIKDLTFNGFCKRFRLHNFDTLAPEYARYLFRSDQFRDLVNEKVTGDTRFNISQQSLGEIAVGLPDISTQQHIAKVLSDIDERIDLNIKMNNVLEQTGQTLFSSYFVEGKEDGHQNKLTIGDVADIVDCLHSKKPEQLLSDTGNIFLQLNNISANGILDLTSKFYISDEDYKKWTSRIEASENDFVITNVGRSGAVAKIPSGVKAALGRNMTAIRLRDDFKYPGFFSFYMNSNYFKDLVKANLDQGTILSALNVKSIPKLSLPDMTKVSIDDKEKEFYALRIMIEGNHGEAQSLINTRNLLLPRLISGKINI